jgi:hypothetical protein
VRPFSALPPRILVTIAIVPCLCLAAIVAGPPETAILTGLLLAATLAGGGWVAVQAARRRALPPRVEFLAPSVDQGSAQGLAAFVAAAVLLVACAAPDLYFKDAGELSAAAHGLGVAHPTGFPAWCLAGKAASLLPFGNAFFRLNVLSAVSMAATAALALAIAGVVVRDHPGGGKVSWALWVAPVALLVHPGAWLHGTTTEVYAFSAAGLAATLLAFVRGAVSREDRWIVLGWFLVGAGAGGHVTWPLYGAGCGLLVTLLRAFEGGFRVRVLALSILFAVLGSLIVGYLPVAASRDPVSNWGNPDSLGRLMDHLTARRIRDSFGLEQFDAGRFVSRLGLAARILWDGTGLVWPLAAWAVAGRRRSGPVAAVFLLVLGDLLYAARINPMGIRDLQTGVPAALGVAILAAIGAGDLACRAAGRPLGRILVPCCVVVLLGIQLALSPAQRDMGPVDANGALCRELLARVPVNASILTTSDDLSAGLSALQAVEAARPDVLVLVRQQVADTAYVARKVRGHRVGPADDELLEILSTRPFESGGEPIGAAQERLLAILHRRGPVFLELGEGRVDQALLPFVVPQFPAVELASSRPASGDVSARAREAADEAESLASTSDRWGREYLAGFLRILGASLGRTGLDADAEILTRKALTLAPDSPGTLHNLAILARDRGSLDEALGLARAAVEADPDYLPGWRALAGIAEALGRTEEAEEARERVRELE